MSFIAELRRRQVFRTAAWYGGAAWVAIEVSSTIFPQFGLPAWSVRAVIVAAALGLPIALLLAWSFDLTASGVSREIATEADASARTPLWRMPSLWFALILGAGLAISAQQAWHRLVLPTGQRPAIAVLPFTNLSPDPENAYFADGLHEEVLATLARVGSLRVISSTSVQQYRDSKRSLTEIADALGVDLILEGSVRRSGEDMRLTLQLIDGRSDEHLWAETYDRKFRNALQLQTSIAERVVAAIGATLSPAEQQLMERVAPTVPEAYDAYLHALALAIPFGSLAVNAEALALLDSSIELDPGFAPSYALRARLRIWATSQDTDNVTLADDARADIERALEIRPDLPEALVARGLYSTYILTDPESALNDLNRALAMTPSDAAAQHAAGMTLRRLGRYDEAIRHFDAAAGLAPGDQRYAFLALETLCRLGRIDEAEPRRQSLLERYPGDAYLRWLEYFNRFEATGAVSGWREAHARLESSLPEDDQAFFRQAVLLATGDLAGYTASVNEGGGEAWLGSRDFSLATAYLALGEPELARPHLQATAARVSTHPDDPVELAEGAVALELQGHSAEALRAADRAMMLRPEKTDSLNGGMVALLRAWVLIHSGDRAEEGYAELERLLGTIVDRLPRWVAVDPLWLLLRDDARTQQIIRSKFPRS